MAAVDVKTPVKRPRGIRLFGHKVPVSAQIGFLIVLINLILMIFASVLAPYGEGVHVLGPAPAPLHLVRGLYRWRYLVKARRGINVQAFIRAWLGTVKPTGSLRLAIDVDPYSFL